MIVKRQLFPISKKFLWIGGISVFLLIILLGEQRGITIRNGPLTNTLNTVTKKVNELALGFIPNGADQSLDPAKELFLDKKSPDALVAKEVTKYINQANNAIPLTPESLQFALMELVLAKQDLALDAALRLEEGKTALQKIEPPLDVLAFHRMSIELLEEYRRVILIPLTIPREKFDPSQLEDDFKRLDLLVAIAKQELRLASTTYGVSLFSNVIRFYDEAIGLKER